MIFPPNYEITGATPLRDLDFFVREKSNPLAAEPSTLPAPLSVTAIDLGEAAEACDRHFTANGDRALVAQKIGRAVMVLSLTAQASGTTLAKCLEAHRAAHRAAATKANHVAA